MTITLLYGTETGNAELVADELMEALEADFSVRCEDMAAADPIQLGPQDRVILVCSTYGDGELPHSAQPFFERLNSERPDLSGLRFATFGLGDSFYKTFNRGSQILAELLSELGATEVGERGVHDASSGELPGEVALAWLKPTLEQLA